MSEALVIIPTYNEIENIGKIIDAVMRLSDGFDVLVIDDVLTTGATLLTCCNAIHQAAPSARISVLALAVTKLS